MAESRWEPVIGLEVHAQLLTKTKIFCGCPTDFGAPPNAQTCPVCLGLPGVLPALNARVVEFAVRAGLALDCTIRRESVFSRKNYFYPDLPKGYQITQFELPICERGGLVIDVPGGQKRAGITRIHLEEDAGKNTHDPDGGPSRVDLNRAGVPLIEIVGEPDLRSSDEAVEYLKALRDVLVYLGVNDGNLEEGSFRCDANVSIRQPGEKFRNRVELKNINSFRNVKLAIEFELQRQARRYEAGEAVVTETRLFDPQRGETRSMRSKEEAHDYRYFPEPDLLPLRIDDAFVEAIRASLPELPRAKVERLVRAQGLSDYDAKVLAADRFVADFHEASLAAYGGAPKTVANWVINELLRLAKDAPEGLRATKVTPATLASLLQALDEGKLNPAGGKLVLEELHREGGEPLAIMQARGLTLVSDTGAIEAAIDEVLAASPGEVEKYRGGKKNLLGFFMGGVMKKLGGKGDPKLVAAAVQKKLG